jgi:hypothetical protein
MLFIRFQYDVPVEPNGISRAVLWWERLRDNEVFVEPFDVVVYFFRTRLLLVVQPCYSGISLKPIVSSL